MTATIKVGGRLEVRLPEGTARALRIRKGTKLGVRVSGDTVVLAPIRRAKDQESSSTDDWLKKERQVAEELARGDVFGPFEDIEEAIEALHTAEV